MNKAEFQREYDSKIAAFRRSASQDLKVFQKVILECLKSGVIEGHQAIALRRVSQNLANYPANRGMLLKDLYDVVQHLERETGNDFSESNSRQKKVITDLWTLYDKISGIKTKIAGLAKEIQAL